MGKLTGHIHFWLSITIVALMPVWKKAIPGFIILLFINWLIARFVRGFPPRNNLAITILLVGFYGLHALGLHNTEDMTNGFFELEVKLSFLALPIIYGFTTPFRPKQIRRMLEFFVGGVVVANLYCLGNSTYLYFTETAKAFQFFGPYYSKIMHLGYAALYLNFAIVCLVALWAYFGDRYQRWMKVLMAVLIIWFSFAVIQTSSKNGILTLLLLYPAIGTYIIIKKRKIKQGLIGMACAVLAIVGLLVASPRTFYRFEVMWEAITQAEFEKTSTESTALRLFAWDSALELIGENPVLGVGTGDAGDALIARYEENGYTGALEKKINAHSQFFQTGVALGVTGLVWLVLLFAVITRVAWKFRKRVLGLFVLIMMIYALTEAVFEVQAGVVFFVFWVCMLTYSIPRLGKR